MVTRQMATPAQQSTARAYKPHVRILDAERGLYTVQSERYTHVLYAVDVLQGTCACESGQRAFKGVKRLGGVCKHLYITRQYHAHRMAADLPATTGRPTTPEVAASVAPGSGSGLGVRVASAGEGYEVYSLRTGALICTVDDPAQAGLPTAPARSVNGATPAPAFIPAPPAFSDLFAA